MTDYHLLKVTNRLREVDGNKFTKVHPELINAERRVELIRNEITEEKEKETPDKAVLDILNARLIVALQEVGVQKTKHGLRA